MDKNVRELAEEKELHELAKDIRKILDSPVLPSVREIAQSLITDGWHKDIKPSPSEFKVIGDEEICSYCPSNNLCLSANGEERLNCNLKKLAKGAVQAQLTADLKAHAGIMADKDKEIAGLIKDLKELDQKESEIIKYRLWQLDLIGIINNAKIPAKLKQEEIKVALRDKDAYSDNYEDGDTPDEAWQGELQAIRDSG